jgi:DNA-binding NtrC family response regulator
LYARIEALPIFICSIPDRWHSSNGPLPLLITDVVMPGFSGRVLAERLTAARPETKVLYTSGYAGDEVAQHGLVGAEFAFLEKPFTRDALIRKVREILDLPLAKSNDANVQL